MYRESSPVFDVPEFPTLRRVKPLPKRRRTSAATDVSTTAPATPFLSASIPLDMLSDPLSEHMNAEQIIAHAEEISKKITQSFYMNGLQNFIPQGIDYGEGASTASESAQDSTNASQILSDVELLSEAALKAQGLPADILRSLTEKLSLPGFPPAFSTPSGRVDLDAIFAAGYEAGLTGAGLRNMPQSKYAPFYRPQFHQPSGESPAQGVFIEGDAGEESARRQRGGRDEDEEDEDGDGDYVDHLRQPGNTKKRKVPANAGLSPSRAGTHREDGAEEDVAGYGAKRVGPDGGHDEERAGACDHHDTAGEGGNLGDPTYSEGGGRPGIHTNIVGSRRGGRLPLSTLSTATLSSSSAARVGQLNTILKARGKLSAAMVAGLQHKEMLKARKRQLAAVMGALTHGDSLALDKALSMAGTGHPFGGPLTLSSMKENEEGGVASQVRIRRSKRTSVRLARAMTMKKPIPRHPDEIPLPASDFAFRCPSDTADRLLATKKEVEALRSRFEAELERQAQKAAKLAATSKMSSAPTSNGTPTRSRKKEKGQNKRAATGGGGAGAANSGVGSQAPAPKAAPRTTTQGAPQQGQAGDGNATLAQLPPIPTSKPKKKKRSALANASNPHHLRNYVPSRLPQSAGGHHSNVANATHGVFGPLPIRFLNAELPTRRGSKKGTGGGSSVIGGTGSSLNQLVGAGDEWLCMFCEYDLFYGDDVAFRKAVKNRKKILKRRQRARERAAAAASGVKSIGKNNNNSNAASNNNHSTAPAAPGGPTGNAAEEELDPADEFDGDPGYESGGNGRDEYGNLPKHRTGTKGGGTGGGGAQNAQINAGQAASVG